jgi:hypothetical protein
MSSQTDGTYDPEAARRSRRRKQAIVGAVGVVAILGGSAFFVTEAMTAKETIVPEAAYAPPAPSSPGPATASVRPPAAGRTTRVPAAKLSRMPSAQPKTTKPVGALSDSDLQPTADPLRPLPRPNEVVPDSAITVSETGSLRAGGTLKVVSARADLTGQRELAWVADGGRTVGDAECSQKIRLSPDAPARVRPTLLLCWRTSGTKSVYTVAVNRKGRPSTRASIAALDRRWAELG